MSTPKDKVPGSGTPGDKPRLNADRFEELHDKVARGLDDSLAVQGSDEDEGPAASADSGALAALESENGDPMPGNENDGDNSAT